MTEPHMLSEQSPSAMGISLDHLVAYCEEETQKFFRRRANDTRFCFELLRRALAEQLPEALAHVFRVYEPLIRGWVRHHPCFKQTGEDVSFFAAGALHTFYFALRGSKFGQFSSIERVLKYMRMCVNTVIMQYLRADRVETSVLLPETAQGQADYDEHIIFDECWQHILDLVPDEKDRLLVYCYFILDMKPAEIVAVYQSAWENTEKIRVALQRIRRTLSRDSELRRRAGLTL